MATLQATSHCVVFTQHSF